MLKLSQLSVHVHLIHVGESMAVFVLTDSLGIDAFFERIQSHLATIHCKQPITEVSILFHLTNATKMAGQVIVIDSIFLFIIK